MMPKTSKPTLGAAGFAGMPSRTGVFGRRGCTGPRSGKEPWVTPSVLFFIQWGFGGFFLQYQWPDPGSAARQGLLHWKCREELIF